MNATPQRPTSTRFTVLGRLRRGPLAAILVGCLALPLGASLSAADLVKVKVKVGPAVFRAELAQTTAEQLRGLMFRRQLPPDQGMLFIQPPGRAEFWMKNTLIPLDLLYFDVDGTLLEIVAAAQPCRQPQCPTYPSESAAVHYILEINGGEAARRAIKVGAQLELEQR